MTMREELQTVYQLAEKARRHGYNDAEIDALWAFSDLVAGLFGLTEERG